ncbi:GIP [Symbiodinium natans]|uniref:GIP protein n=1 Tax=Symbiodinium natans TaxID=878477 RepID=A0A812J8Z6_9DINO|nr:GIP [Symbiodinium natans]
MEVAVRQPSGAAFNVKVGVTATLTDMKAAIATRTKVAVGRQKLVFGTRISEEPQTPVSELLSADDPPEVLLLVGSSCTLASHSHGPPAVWDADSQTVLWPASMTGGATDAMRLGDGELYTLLKQCQIDAQLYFLQLVRGIPGSEVIRYPLPVRWMEESVFARFSPEGDFVMAESMGKLLMWRTLTGEVHLRSDGTEWTGSVCSLQPGLALISDGGIMSRTLELWDYHSGTRKQACGKEDGLSTASFLLSLSGKWIAKWYYKEPMVVLEVGHEGSDQSFCDSYVDRAAFSPDETEIVVSYPEDMSIAVIRLCDGLTRTTKLPFAAPHYFTSIGFAADASVIFLAVPNGKLHRWACDTLELLPATPDPPKEVMVHGPCGDGNFYYRSDRAGDVQVLDLLCGAVHAFALPKA